MKLIKAQTTNGQIGAYINPDNISSLEWWEAGVTLAKMSNGDEYIIINDIELVAKSLKEG